MKEKRREKSVKLKESARDTRYKNIYFTSDTNNISYNSYFPTKHNVKQQL